MLTLLVLMDEASAVSHARNAVPAPRTVVRSLECPLSYKCNVQLFLEAETCCCKINPVCTSRCLYESLSGGTFSLLEDSREQRTSIASHSIQNSPQPFAEKANARVNLARIHAPWGPPNIQNDTLFGVLTSDVRCFQRLVFRTEPLIAVCASPLSRIKL